MKKMIPAEDLLQLVGELAAQVGPDTEFRWKRGLDWQPDDEANSALRRRFGTWRTCRATPERATLCDAPGALDPETARHWHGRLDAPGGRRR